MQEKRKEKTLRIPLNVYERLKIISKRMGFSEQELILMMIDYSFEHFDFVLKDTDEE